MRIKIIKIQLLLLSLVGLTALGLAGSVRSQTSDGPPPAANVTDIALVKVEAMLLAAAARTPGLRKEPAPFVPQTSLGDYAITYELNVSCPDAHKMIPLYSELRRNILDLFNEYGVAIMTPSYIADPPEPKVVPKNEWYQAPAKPPDPERKIVGNKLNLN